MPSINRRDFLKIASGSVLAVGGLLGLNALIRFLSFEPAPPPPKEYNIGDAVDYLPGTRTILPEIPAIIFNDGTKFTVTSLICTHLGCTVEAKPEHFICPCHGSQYDLNGKVVRGPASQPLKQLTIEKTTEGKLIVYK
jgi:cytochrome b6-f complex iron-sulfur subunit